MIALFTLGEEHKRVRMQIQFEEGSSVGEGWIETWCPKTEEWMSDAPFTVPIYLHELEPVVAFVRQVDKQLRVDIDKEGVQDA
jgi:hypothetical protein